MRGKNISGQVFGRLTAVSAAGKDNLHNLLWLCRCSCGKEVVVNRRSLMSGNTKSCGCYRADCTSARKRIHGVSGSHLAMVWSNMMRRCYDPKNKNFGRYGGRGIAVCPEWHTCKGFIDDMGQSYRPGLTLDRRDNDLGYSLANCRWADYRTQQNNRSNNVFLDTPLGRMTQAQACRTFGVARSTFNRWFLSGVLAQRMGWE